MTRPDREITLLRDGPRRDICFSLANTDRIDKNFVEKGLTILRSFLGKRLPSFPKEEYNDGKYAGLTPA